MCLCSQEDSIVLSTGRGTTSQGNQQNRITTLLLGLNLNVKNGIIISKVVPNDAKQLKLK